LHLYSIVGCQTFKFLKEDRKLHPEEDGRREKKDFLKVMGNQVIIASLDSTGLFLQIKITVDNMTVTYLLINPAISRLLF
jgi:hypothetical protein